MPTYKLTYFKMKGRAEMTRLVFVAAGVKYEDCRLTREEFEELKASKFKYIIIIMGQWNRFLWFHINVHNSM